MFIRFEQINDDKNYTMERFFLSSLFHMLEHIEILIAHECVGSTFKSFVGKKKSIEKAAKRNGYCARNVCWTTFTEHSYAARSSRQPNLC